MLSIASTPAYKDLLATLGRLVDWTEQAGNSSLPSGPPSAELVERFQRALAQMPAESSAAAPQAVNATHTEPEKVIADARLFRPANDSADVPAETAKGARERLRREPESLTQAQQVNLEHGMEHLEAAAHHKQDMFLKTARSLSEIFSKPAEALSPMDLLQAQRLVGILRVEAEAGQKLSEGVSETLEELLQQSQA